MFDVCIKMPEQINYPLLKTFEVDSSIVNFLNVKLEEYKKSYPSTDDFLEENAFTNKSKKSGYQTDNMLSWDDIDFINFCKNDLSKIIKSQFDNRIEISYYFIHMLEYENGGSMDYHTHMHNEDYVLFIYLETCKVGDTIFHLNYYNEEYAKRTEIKLKPKKCLGAIFSSMVLHKGEYTEENKKIFVVGIRIDTNSI